MAKLRASYFIANNSCSNKISNQQKGKHMKTIRISSPQVPSVYLQTITEQDASYEYVEWLNDPLINQYLETRFYVQDLTAIKNFIHLMISDPNEHLFTIRLKESHKHIGNIKIGGIKPHHHVGEVSLFIGDKKS